MSFDYAKIQFKTKKNIAKHRQRIKCKSTTKKNCNKFIILAIKMNIMWFESSYDDGGGG